MDIQKIKEDIEGFLPEQCIKENEPMKLHTTFQIGGPVTFYLTPYTVEQLEGILKYCNQHKIPYLVIGKGSNLLIADQGLEGIVIELGKQFSDLKVEQETIEASSGISLSKLAEEALHYGLTGLEFAHGIPGTLGGAVTMNAGAYGGEMKHVLLEARVMDSKGTLFTLTSEELELGYRKSIIQTKGYVVVSAKIGLKKGDPKKIQDKMEELKAKREEKQPLEYGSAGSTFKRPEGYFAGKLIMDSGLRGYTVGGAKVSDKHCGFVINFKEATFTEVKTLIEHIQSTVKEQFGVVLEPEVKMIEKLS